MKAEWCNMCENKSGDKIAPECVYFRCSLYIVYSRFLRDFHLYQPHQYCRGKWFIPKLLRINFLQVRR
jgi:hypothetical protein